MTNAEPPLPYIERIEARRIALSAGVVASSLEIHREELGLIVSFAIATEPMAEAPKADVRDVERIHFVYKAGCRFGETAPHHVLCDRPDFPRNIGHLCAGEPGCAAAPCLALGGLQPLYERGGIEALMVRLRDFLRDARTGSLMADGWEPVPFAVGQTFRAGEVTPAFFQDHAAAHPAGGHAFGVAVNCEREQGTHVVLVPQVIEAADMVSAMAFRNTSGEKVGIPWLFLWPSQDKIESDPLFEDWRTGAELEAGLKQIGLASAFDVGVGALLGAGVDFTCHRPPLGAKALVVVVGIWRPSPIMPAFFGYSDDPAARRLELRAFHVSRDRMGEIVAADTIVETVVGSYPPSPELLRWVSGVGDLPPIALLGFGALGSAIYEGLARSGMEDVLVQDKDSLLSHNLARHSGRTSDVFKSKTELATPLLHAIARDGVSPQVFNEDIVATALPVLAARVAGRLVIDVTADEQVRLKLDELRSNVGETMLRAELFHEGRLGVTFVAMPDGPGFADMMIRLLAEAVEDRVVAAWLAHEARYPLGPDPMLYGFGCTSPTVRLPGHVVAAQASAAMTVILDKDRGSGIAINPLDERLRPLGWRWLPVAPFRVPVPATQKSWSIRLSQDVVAFLAAERERALPNETGGYLYGRWDPVRSSITIVRATPLPPGSTAGPAALELGPVGQTRDERRLLRKTQGRLFLCGTWHSHPAGSARMSGRDNKAMSAHHERDAQALRPTLIVIVAENDLQAHLRIS